MKSDLIHDRGRGPEIVGTRITVYNLLPHFLDPTATEGYLCKLYELTPDQVAAARAYILNHADTVLAQHLKIEERLTAGNPPEVIAQAAKTRAAFLNFKNWIAERNRADAAQPPLADNGDRGNGQFPSFREWLAEQSTPPAGSA